ncbi:hypothetical protein [Bradyrhizobium sp. C9]|uniref:hypothetical protein n=1 Tax=Bradyrhizobium sp. C9 TaxID=142585 RepID=UPI0018E921F5|nr:hypothetical protein [Bradyrhizobium sp. C9]
MSATTKPFRLPGHIVLPEPKLRFGSNNPHDIDIHPMEGLIRFGPYSLGKLSPVPNSIRIGVILPAELEESLVRQMRELEQVHQPRERKQYLRRSPASRRFSERELRAGAQRAASSCRESLTERLKPRRAPTSFWPKR